MLFRSTVGPGDLAERVAIHRDVWEPSRVTESSYRGVMVEWPYRGSLDCVVEAPDGRFAAYCLVWPDDENRVGELEPVGVREEFRRRGLGAAVCTFALRVALAERIFAANGLSRQASRKTSLTLASPMVCSSVRSTLIAAPSLTSI